MFLLFAFSGHLQNRRLHPPAKPRPAAPPPRAPTSRLKALQLALLALTALARPACAQLPVTGGLYTWYDASASATAANIVVDRSGNGRTGTVTASAGLSMATDAAGTWGVSPTCTAGLTYVSGTTATQARRAAPAVAEAFFFQIERLDSVTLLLDQRICLPSRFAPRSSCSEGPCRQRTPTASSTGARSARPGARPRPPVSRLTWRSLATGLGFPLEFPQVHLRHGPGAHPVHPFLREHRHGLLEGLRGHLVQRRSVQRAPRRDAVKPPELAHSGARARARGGGEKGRRNRPPRSPTQPPPHDALPRASHFSTFSRFPPPRLVPQCFSSSAGTFNFGYEVSTFRGGTTSAGIGYGVNVFPGELSAFGFAELLVYSTAARGS